MSKHRSNKKKGGKDMNSLQATNNHVIDFTNEKKDKPLVITSYFKMRTNKYIEAIKSLSPEEMQELSDLVEDKEK